MYKTREYKTSRIQYNTSYFRNQEVLILATHEKCNFDHSSMQQKVILLHIHIKANLVDTITFCKIHQRTMCPKNGNITIIAGHPLKREFFANHVAWMEYQFINLTICHQSVETICTKDRQNNLRNQKLFELIYYLLDHRKILVVNYKHSYSIHQPNWHTT